jgi:hypothetical protein
MFALQEVKQAAEAARSAKLGAKRPREEAKLEEKKAKTLKSSDTKDEKSDHGRGHVSKEDSRTGESYL